MHFLSCLKGFWLKQRFFMQAIFLSLVLTLGIMGTASHSIPSLGTDPFFYREIALGHLAEVPQPFSARVLHPLLIRAFHLATHVSVDQLYFVIGCLCLFLIYVLLQLILRSETSALRGILLIFATPFFIQLGHAYYFTDLFFVLLLCLFFWCVQKKKISHPLSLLLVLALFLTRESTILLSIVCIGISLYKRQWKDLVLVSIVTVIGWKLSGFIGQMGALNAHGIGSLVYLAGKFAFNGLRNIFGLPLFPNTLIPESGAPCQIVHTYSLPASLARGSIRTVSRCVFDKHLPTITLVHAATLFGIGPMCVIWMLKKIHAIRSRLSPMTIIAFWYGLLSFLCAPLFGSSTDRLLAMGWPLFLIAVPITLLFGIQKELQTRLALTWFIVAWSGWLLIYLPGSFFVRALTALLIALIGYTFSFIQLTRALVQPTAS